MCVHVVKRLFDYLKGRHAKRWFIDWKNVNTISEVQIHFSPSLFFFFCFGRKDLQYVWTSFLRHTLKLKSSIFIFCFRRCIWICLFFLNYEIPIVLIMCWYLPKLYLLSTILSVRLVFSNCFFFLPVVYWHVSASWMRRGLVTGVFLRMKSS